MEPTQNPALPPFQTCLLRASAICSDALAPLSGLPLYPGHVLSVTLFTPARHRLSDPRSSLRNPYLQVVRQVLALTRPGFLWFQFLPCVCFGPIRSLPHNLTIPAKLVPSSGFLCSQSLTEYLANSGYLLVFERMNAAFITRDIEVCWHVNVEKSDLPR